MTKLPLLPTASMLRSYGNPYAEGYTSEQMTAYGKDCYEAALVSNKDLPGSKPYAWRNPTNGVVISNDKKEQSLSVGRGYPNFSEPLYTIDNK